jgi:hypothetical protein
MTLAAGLYKRIAYKEETTYGTLAGAAGAKMLRRVDGTLNLKKDAYKSNEIRTDLQTADMRHGVRKIEGSLNGELSVGSYADFFAALCKRPFAAVTAITGASITIAPGANSTYTLTRAAGSWLTDGVKVGDVIRLNAGTFNVANSNKNLWVIALTATVATVLVLNGTTMVAEGPIASATVTLPGKKTFIPTSGHLEKSYTIEEWFSDVSRSEVFAGVKVSQASVKLPPSGMATVGWTLMGQDMAQSGAVQYFSSPTAAGTTPVLAAVNGLLTVGGTRQLAVTGLDFSINANYSGDPVVGSNVIPGQFTGTYEVSGSFTAYFENGILPDNFFNEDELALSAIFSGSNAAAADFIGFTMSRIKLGGADKNDGQGGIVRTYPFTALLNASGGAGTANEATTFSIQDSLA